MTTRSIGTGGDYSTIAAWFAACPADLVSTTQTWEGELKNETHTLSAKVQFVGVTTNATYYIELRCEAGASFADNANKLTNALRYNASNGAAILCTSSYVTLFEVTESNMYLRMRKLQMSNTGTVAATAFVQGADNGNITLQDCLIEAQGTAAVVTLYGTGSTARNCGIVQRRSLSGGVAMNLINGASAYNCTLLATQGAANALDGTYGTPTVRNCAAFGFVAIKTGGNTPTYTTCATDVAVPPSGFTGGLTTSSQIESATDGSHDLRIKSGSALIDTGTTDSTFSPADIVGTSRPSGSAYDISCWEFASGGGGGGVKPPAALLNLLLGGL